MLVLPPDSDALFAEFLRENGVVTPDAIRNVSGTPSGKLIETLISNGAANEDAIAESLMHFFGINHTAVDAAMAAQRPMQEKLNTNFILRTRIAPLEVVGSVLKVALADPDAFNNVNDVKMMAGCSVETYVTTLTEMGKYMQALQSAPAGKPVPAKAKAAPQAKVASVHRLPQQALLADFSGKQETEQESHSEVINFVNEVIMDAVLMGVSDIHIESFREKARVRFRRDGVLQDMAQFEEFLTFNYSAVTTRIKILASLDISERRLPQDGGISSDKLDKAVDIRVSVLPTVHGERIVLRILDPDAANFTLDQIGMPEGELKKLRKAINSPQGMLLVTGPTGSGKSTTLYAILKELNDGKINIMTAEDPVEYRLEGINQVSVKSEIGLTFATALKAFLRQDPDIIMVGETRDLETASICVRAALTGHFVLSTLHTNDAASAITRLTDIGVPNYLLTP
ncbi:MAG: type II/IV secretion system protein, partial [Rickettsiales bacterium]|nr:type II/IV secretion system protein [Rickettsiales bacterium]